MIDKSLSNFEFDTYYEVPHPTLAWQVLHVYVHQTEAGYWEQAHGFSFMSRGMGSPLMGRYPSRDAAGRNGMCFLREALLRVSCPKARLQAQAHAAEIWETLNPTQRQFNFA